MSSVIYYGGTVGAANFTTTVSASSGTSTITATGVSFGPARPDRIAAVAVMALTNPNDNALVSATIGGVAATIHGQGSELATSSYMRAAVISARLPTGTTATVVLNFTGGSTSYSASLTPYGMTGLFSATPIDTATYAAVADPATMQIDVEKYGVLIVSIVENYDNTVTLGGFTQDHYAGGGNLIFVAGHYDVTATEANRVISVANNSPNTMQVAMVAASFR